MNELNSPLTPIIRQVPVCGGLITRFDRATDSE